MYSGLDCINRLWHKLNEAIFNLDLAITGKLGNFSRMWHVMEINIHVRFCRFSPTESAMSPESPTSRLEQPGTVEVHGLPDTLPPRFDGAVLYASPLSSFFSLNC
jgi:hypothetical protein